MTYVVKPKFHTPPCRKNALGFTHARLRGGGVDAIAPAAATIRISASIIEACFELSIEPPPRRQTLRIGCSSKTPTYFLRQLARLQLGARAHAVGAHRRQSRQPRSDLSSASPATGDSASIGFGQFAHAIRRGVNMVYIVENNGVYGLTKGQFSATPTAGSEIQGGSST